MKGPLVSVIIPTYNRANLISETIDSVLSQTYDNFEIILIDDGSTDNTKEVILSYKDERIKYIWQENFGRASGPRNKGLKIAKGKYIAFLDHDDLWYPEKIEKQVKILEENNNFKFVSTNALLTSSSKTQIGFEENDDMIYSFKKMLRGNVVFTSSALLRKDIIDELGNLDTDADIADDYDYWLRILRKYDNSLYVIREPLIKYRIHEENIFGTFDPTNKTFKTYYNACKYVLKKHLDYDEHFINYILYRKLYTHRNENYIARLTEGKIHPIKILIDKYMQLRHKSVVLIDYFSRKYKLPSTITKMAYKIFHFFLVSVYDKIKKFL